MSKDVVSPLVHGGSGHRGLPIGAPGVRGRLGFHFQLGPVLFALPLDLQRRDLVVDLHRGQLNIRRLLNIHHVELAIEYADRIIGICAGQIVYDGPSKEVKTLRNVHLPENHGIAAVGRMFPSVNLNGAVQKAQEAISGTPDSLEGVSAAARSLGLNVQTVNNFFSKYGNTMQARALCGLLGTTPEALKADADRILGNGGSGFQPPQSAKQGQSRFPRLK